MTISKNMSFDTHMSKKCQVTSVDFPRLRSSLKNSHSNIVVLIQQLAALKVRPLEPTFFPKLQV